MAGKVGKEAAEQRKIGIILKTLDDENKKIGEIKKESGKLTIKQKEALKKIK